jgi:hypothetical protein
MIDDLVVALDGDELLVGIVNGGSCREWLEPCWRLVPVPDGDALARGAEVGVDAVAGADRVAPPA